MRIHANKTRDAQVRSNAQPDVMTRRGEAAAPGFQDNRPQGIAQRVLLAQGDAAPFKSSARGSVMRERHRSAPAVPIQRMKLAKNDDDTAYVQSDAGEALDTLELAPPDRIELSKELVEMHQDDLLADVRAEWIDADKNHDALITHQAAELVRLTSTYAEGIKDPLKLQYRIQQFVTQFARDIVAEVLAFLGMDVNDFAVLMVGSAARRELFPASDVDLLLLGEARQDKNVEVAVKADVDGVLSAVVNEAYEELGKQAAGGKLPFSLDACLSGGLFYTPKSAVKAAATSGGSSDNMVADTTLLNPESEQARDLFEDFRGGYEAELDKKHQQMRRGFVPERINEMYDKVDEAEKQLQERKSGFDVKRGLLRPPSLLARDYATFRGPEDSTIFQIPAEHTLERLETFTRGNEETRIDSDAIVALQRGFQYGIRLRMVLHVVTGAEEDVLPPEVKNNHKAEIKDHIKAYRRAIGKFEEVAERQQLKPRPPTKLNKFFGV